MSWSCRYPIIRHVSQSTQPKGVTSTAHLQSHSHNDIWMSFSRFIWLNAWVNEIDELVEDSLDGRRGSRGVEGMRMLATHLLDDILPIRLLDLVTTAF